MAALALVAGCAAPEEQDQIQIDEQSSSIVYGKDDRRDVYDHPDPRLRALAQSAIAALIPKERIQRPATGEIRLLAPSLLTAYDLCPNERFLDQLVAADCSSVLIDRDLVLSAGHCFEERTCEEYSFVFDYFYRSEGTLELIRASDVYACRKLIIRKLDVSQTGKRIDFAIAQLDRPVLDRQPAALRSTPLQAAEPLVVIGTGSGLPLKIDSSASVLDPRANEGDYFAIEADTFEGSSGSGVFDAEGGLAGILVRGGTDYEEDRFTGCLKVRTREKATLGELEMGELGHEQATYAARAVEALCAEGFPSAALCTTEAVCGDGLCTNGERARSCPIDCAKCVEDRCDGAKNGAALRGDHIDQNANDWHASAAGCALAGGGSQSHWSALCGLLFVLLGRSRRANRRFL